MSQEIFIHNTAQVLSDSLGENTRIWQYVIVLEGAVIGEDCNICSHCFIESDVLVGDRVTIKNGVSVWDGLRIGSDVFVGPNVTFTNDKFPRSKVRPEKYLPTCIEDGASIGAGAVILPNLTIGTNAMVAAGAVVVRSIPPNAIAAGNPARIIGYVDSETEEKSQSLSTFPVSGVADTSVKGVRMHGLPKIQDIRGSLSVGEFEQSIPFPVKRYFLVYDVPSKETRGEHAHHECHQFLICVRGSCHVVADDGNCREEFELNSPERGLHIPPRVWGIQYKYSADAMLLVFASHYYDSSDYIRDYSEFNRIVNS